MSHILLPLLILAISPSAPNEGRYPEAVETFACGFEADWDANFDGWPDNWVRRRGPDYPHYVKIGICETPTPEGKNALRIDLDGGAAAIRGPMIPIRPSYSYVLECRLKTEGLVYDEVVARLIFLDENQKSLEVHESTPVVDVPEWSKVLVGPVAPSSQQARFAVVTLQVRPTNRQDLTGSVFIDDVWLGRLPRLQIRTNSETNFFTSPEDVEITCELSGVSAEQPHIDFQLHDVFGQILAREEKVVPARRSLSALTASEEESGNDFSGEVHWKPPIPRYGYYRVHVELPGSDSTVHQREIPLAVIQPQARRPHGEFGWSLHDGDEPLSRERLEEILPEVGIHWVKYPLWFQSDDEAEGEQLSRFVERLQARGISVVGLLHDPPEDVRQKLGSLSNLTASQTFTPPPEVWYPSLETVMLRLSHQVRWWQLGDDLDHSFVGYFGLAGKIAQTRDQLNQSGQNVQLGFGSGWLDEMPESSQSPWAFLALSADPPLTPEELKSYLEATNQSGYQRWVSIAPQDKGRYSTLTRAADLVERMMAAKIHQAEAIIVREPFSETQGLMGPDGTPGEMLLPWRTAALALAGSHYLGELRLPGGSHNRVFSRGSDAMMVVWNETPTREVLYLGEDVTVTDIWGHSAEPLQEGDGQAIEVGPTPVFVSGLNDAVARWRMSLQLTVDQVPSVFAHPHETTVMVKNPFPQSVSGQVTFTVPEDWETEPGQVGFRLGVGGSFQRNILLKLPFDTDARSHPMRVDFDITADRHYRFSVYRSLEVGLGDTDIEMNTVLRPDGNLQVDVRLINRTSDPVTFNCDLYAPNRRRQRVQVIELASGHSDKVYSLHKGAELIGQEIWLRAEEIDGPRVLNYHLRVAP
jgi:hypothetical protein